MRRAIPILRSFGARLGRQLACGLAGIAVALIAGSADAADRIDCAAINKGALNADQVATASTEHEVALRAEERLAFHWTGGAGSATLVSGPDTPRLLNAGSGRSPASYTAPRDGIFVFRFSLVGTTAASLAATCTPASRAGKTAAQKHPARITPERWESLLAVPEAEMAGVGATLEPPITLPGGSAALATTVPGAPGPAAGGPLRPATGLDGRLKWEGKTNEPNAPQDPARTDVADATTTLGVKYKLQPQIMIGVLAQFDQAADTVPGAAHTPTQQPWIAGPVATIQLAPGLALDARAAWGSGETSLADRLAGISATERRLIDAKLASSQSFGPWRFSPTVTLNYAEEKAGSSAITTHDALVARSTAAGRVDVTPEVAYRIEMPHAMYIEPKAAVGSFWDIDGLSRLAPRGAVREDIRLKAQGGVAIGSMDGTKLEVGGGVEGGGPAAPDVWSGRLQLSVPLK
jgi:hypothetical protein